MELAEMKFTYVQDADSCDPLMNQELEAEFRDEGDGPYLVIKTERWAFDNRLEAISLINKIFSVAFQAGLFSDLDGNNQTIPEGS